jgi:hypothetical protein
MTVQELYKLVCKDAVRGLYERNGRSFIVTRFSYPSGESVNVYLAGSNGKTHLTDRGTTQYNLGVGGIDLTDQRAEFVDAVCALYDVVLVGNALTKLTSAETAGRDLLVFCEAITRISTLQYDASVRKRSSFREEVETFMTTRVEALRRVLRNWHEPIFDPRGSHLVDYRTEPPSGPDDARHIFSVTSSEKAERVTGTVHFLESRNIRVPSMVLIEPALNLAGTKSLP